MGYVKKTREDYFELYSKAEPTSRTISEAFEVAFKARNIEVGLYWKRASYYWLFNSGIFVGFFVCVTQYSSYPWLLLLISVTGLFLSYAWYLANRGSKFWQVNWEEHVRLLSSQLHGEGLFSTILADGDKLNEKGEYGGATGPLNVSVTRINDILGIFGITLWYIGSFYAISQVVPHCLPCGFLPAFWIVFALISYLVAKAIRDSAAHQVKGNHWYINGGSS